MWKLCEGGNHRCELCGNFIKRAWLYFARPAEWTHCVCENCAEKA